MMTSQTESRNLCFVSWNTNGIKGKKLSNVLDRMETLQADIVFIQETHIGPTCSEIFKDAEKNWKVFFTVHSSRSKGVAILIRNKVPFEYICHDEDCSGGYIVLFCHLYGELYTLVNVYNHKEDRSVLGRLKEYLMETAEGVLVVGGDFNTVLDPLLDREPSTSMHSPFRGNLEDFIVSLNLRDTWSYLHPTEKTFTRRQNENLSRIDMFFLPENRIRRVCETRVEDNMATEKSISDHCPLVLKLTYEEQTENKMPSVATRLGPQTYSRDNTTGNISGAEILSVIKSLADSDERRPDTLDVKYYKTNKCPLTESLKIEYNLMIKNKEVPELFKECYPSGDRQIFNVDYLIFSQIVAKRFRFTPNFHRKKGENLDITHYLSLETGEQEIKWSFLLEDLKMQSLVPYAPTLVNILDSILPKTQNSDEHRRLQVDCPLTNTILNLALNYLKDTVLKSWEIMVTVCYQRKILLIRQPKVEIIVNDFKEKSALKINIKTTGESETPIQGTIQDS